MRKPVYLEQLGLAPAPKEIATRRASKRIPAQGRVALLWIDNDGKLKQAVADLKDLSADGLGLYSVVRLQNGKYLLIDFLNGNHSWGVVRHCTGHDSSYVVGVEYVRE